MSFLPLAGRRVVDVTSSLAGPTCGQLLAALGAEVIKVEPPGGDHARAWGRRSSAARARSSFPRTPASARSRSTSRRPTGSTRCCTSPTARTCCTIEVSLYETALWLLSYQLVGYLAGGEIPGREGSAFAQIAPYQVFPTRDGELMIVAGNDALFRGLCAVLGADELPRDERFRTNPDRARHRAELARLLEDRTRTRDTAELLEALVAAGIPASPVRDVGEAAEHAQTRALGILQDLGDVTTVAQPLSVDGERVLQAGPPPALGEATEAILRELYGQGPAR